MKTLPPPVTKMYLAEDMMRKPLKNLVAKVGYYSLYQTRKIQFYFVFGEIMGRFGTTCGVV
jgi:hypothetical protein